MDLGCQAKVAFSAVSLAPNVRRCGSVASTSRGHVFWYSTCDPGLSGCFFTLTLPKTVTHEGVPYRQPVQVVPPVKSWSSLVRKMSRHKRQLHIQTCYNQWFLSYLYYLVSICRHTSQILSKSILVFTGLVLGNEIYLISLFLSKYLS